jgi:Protein of unknown function (DUF5818)
MFTRIATALLCFLMFAGAAGLSVADDKDKDKDNDKKAVNLTGCLQKGDEANEYVLTANDGSTWEVSSDNVNLAPHVGHTVTIAGTRSGVHAKAHEMKEKAKEEMHEHDMKKSSAEHGHLKVTNMKHVSETCQR